MYCLIEVTDHTCAVLSCPCKKDCLPWVLYVGIVQYLSVHDSFPIELVQCLVQESLV